MSKLQQLLDEKWPLSDVNSENDKSTLELFRRIFTEGYNACMSDIELDMDDVEEAAVKYAMTECITGRCYQYSKQGYMAGAQDWCGNTIIHFQNIDNGKS